MSIVSIGNTEEVKFLLSIEREKVNNEIKDKVRREVAEECSSVIAKLITNELERLDISPSTMDDLYDNIMKIIRGE